MFTGVKFNTKTDPSFLLDAAPFFTPSCLLIAYLICYQLSPSANAMLFPWLMYVGTPLYNMLILNDDTNLRKENERRFANSSMFIIPLYAMVATQTLAWIYGLFLYSDEFAAAKTGNFMFMHRPETFVEHLAFFAGLSFFTGLTSTAGHELVHRRETIHKIVGNLPYVQFFYSHFW